MVMKRYTLSEEVNSSGLFRILDNGNLTNAWGSTEAIDNIYNDCEIKSGTFKGGTFKGGTFKGGTFKGGWFKGGTFYDGTFYDGWFYDGTFKGGTFEGGTFYDGWLPLQIQGSMHFVNIPDGKSIQIGCKNHLPEIWLSNFEKIGRSNGYTKEQIKEYKQYIDLAATMIEDANK